MKKSDKSATVLNRKTANREANEARHQANLDKLQAEGITPRVGSVVKIRQRNGIPVRDKKGSTVIYTKNYDVRPSVLLNSQKRAKAGLHEAWVEASAKSGLTPATSYSTAQHLEAARRKGL